MKKLSFILFAILFVFVLAGCQDSTNKVEESGDVSEVASGNVTKEGSSTSIQKVKYNNSEISLGDLYEDVKDRLGTEIKPSEVAKVCNPYAKGDTTMYYYDGMTVTTNYNGVIISLSISSDNVILDGGLKVGDSPVNCSQILGEPIFESEYGANFKLGRYSVGLVYDDNGNISTISLDDDEAQV